MHTTCPRCHTVFRASEEVLDRHHGLVRCGRCRTVFDGRKHMAGEMEEDLPPPREKPPQSAEPPPLRREALNFPEDMSPRHAAPPPESGAGQPPPPQRTVGHPHPAPAWPEHSDPLEQPQAPKRAPRETAIDLKEPTEEHQEEAESPQRAEKTPPSPPWRRKEAEDKEPQAPTETAPQEDEPSKEAMAADRLPPWRRQERKTGSRLTGVLFFLLAVAFAALLAGQMAYHFRVALAWSNSPLAGPVRGLASALGWSLPLPLPGNGVVVSFSSLEQAGNKADLLTLSASLRNQSGHRVAYPLVELALTNTNDQIVLRRLFAPGEYLAHGADAKAGFAAGGEVNLQMHLQSKVPALGYALSLHDNPEG